MTDPNNDSHLDLFITRRIAAELAESLTASLLSPYYSDSITDEMTELNDTLNELITLITDDEAPTKCTALLNDMRTYSILAAYAEDHPDADLTNNGSDDTYQLLLDDRIYHAMITHSTIAHDIIEALANDLD